jgi:hypothetical protein
LASFKRGLLGNSVRNLLKRQRALSVSPFERRISPSRKREESSGCGEVWANAGLWVKSRKKRTRIKFHPLALLLFNVGDIIDFREITEFLVKVDPIAYDKDIIDLFPKIIRLNHNFSPSSLVKQGTDLYTKWN